MIKLLAMCFLILFYVLTNCVLLLFPRSGERIARFGCFYAKLTLKLLGVKVTVLGTLPSDFKGKVVVSNHLSYVDILVLMSTVPSRFVTFTEFKNIPGIGFLAKLSGTLFIHRSQPAQVKKDVLQIEKALRAGSTIVFFPEGSSFDGSVLHPFKSSLFQSAIVTDSIVQPVCLRYLMINDEKISAANRDKLFYYGDMHLGPQLMGVLRLKSVHVEVIFESGVNAHGKNRKDLSEQARGAILKHFVEVSS